MAYMKFGMDSVGRMVVQPTTDGNLVLLPNTSRAFPTGLPRRESSDPHRRKRKGKGTCKVLEFRTKNFDELG